ARSPRIGSSPKAGGTSKRIFAGSGSLASVAFRTRTAVLLPQSMHSVPETIHDLQPTHCPRLELQDVHLIAGSAMRMPQDGQSLRSSVPIQPPCDGPCGPSRSPGIILSRDGDGWYPRSAAPRREAPSAGALRENVCAALGFALHRVAAAAVRHVE